MTRDEYEQQQQRLEADIEDARELNWQWRQQNRPAE